MRLGILIIWMTISSGIFSAQAHVPNDIEQIKLKSHLFALALLNSSVKEAEPLLHPDFKTISSTYTTYVEQNKIQFLEEVVAKSVELSDASTFYGSVQLDSDGKASFGPVILYIDSGEAAVIGANFNFSSLGEDWFISGLSYGVALPEGINKYDRNVSSLEYTVAFTLKNDDGLISARVNIVDEKGTYWPPNGKPRIVRTGHNERVGGSVVLGTKTFAYVSSDFDVSLPEGQYTITVEHGPEHETVQKDFSVAANSKSIEITVPRLFNMRSEGWISGDTHVHFLDPTTAHLEAAAEDLDIVNLLATQWGRLITGVEHFTGHPVYDPKNGTTVYVNEEARHGQFGHLALLNLQKLVFPLSWGGPGEGVPGGLDYPSLLHHATKVHDQDGFVGWAHLPLHIGELPTLLAHQKLDGVELMVWGDPVHDKYKGKISAAELYYTILNAGFPMPAIGGTDKMTNLQNVGSIRTYAHTDGQNTYEDWIKAVKQGRTFVTSGPLIDFSVNDAIPGEMLQATQGELVGKVRIRSKEPVEVVEIVMNGDMVWQYKNKNSEHDFKTNFKIQMPEEGGWLTARAYADKRLPIQMWPALTPEGSPVFAHTSPIYFMKDGQLPRKRKAVDFLININDQNRLWLEKKGNFFNDEQRTKILQINEETKNILQGLLAD